MNGAWRDTVVRVLVVAACAVSLALASGGCGGRKSGVGMNRPPPRPPAVPPRQNVAVDPTLQDAARREILSALGNREPLIRAHAVEALKEGFGPESADHVIKHLTDDAAVVRFAAALAAGELRLHQAKNALLVLSDDADPSVRIGAKFALHRIGDYRQSHDLEVTSRDLSPRTRGDTALVLGLLGEPSGVNVLLPMLHDRNAAVRLQAAEALWRLGNDTGRDQLISASISRFPDDQMIALLALAAPKNRMVLGHLQGALTSDYDEASLVAARGCGMLGSDDGYGVAMRFIQSSDARRRLLAALALGAIGRPDAQDELAPLLKDPDADVRLAAAQALLQLR